MDIEKSIVIGCDDSVNLSIVLNSMKRKTFFLHSIISTTRVSDLIGIVKSLNPDLVILCFRNNQSTLNDLNTFVNKPDIPVLFLIKKYDTEILHWHKNSIVFTCPLEYINNDDYLNSRINSIFLLRDNTLKKSSTTTLAGAAIQSAESGDNKDLSRYVMELDQKAELLMKVKERITQLYTGVNDEIRAELTSIVNFIKISANDTKLWDDFKLYFEQDNPRFLQLLAQKYPSLTPIDLKYCCYLKMNMTNNDIRNLLGINQESVRTHKYRLKQKMSLPRDQDLRNYLRSVGQKNISAC